MNNTYLTKPAAKQTHLLTALLMVVVVKIQKNQEKLRGRLIKMMVGAKKGALMMRLTSKDGFG